MWLEIGEDWLWWGSVVSATTFVAGLWLVPWLVIRIPEDYFTHDSAWHREHAVHPVWYWVRLVLRNLFGGVLVLLGIAMLVLPGQGILTIVLGLMLVSLPGKFRLAAWLLQRPGVRQTVAWIRRKAKRPPLQFDGIPSPSDESELSGRASDASTNSAEAATSSAALSAGPISPHDSEKPSNSPHVD